MKMTSPSARYARAMDPGSHPCKIEFRMDALLDQEETTTQDTNDIRQFVSAHR